MPQISPPELDTNPWKIDYHLLDTGKEFSTISDYYQLWKEEYGLSRIPLVQFLQDEGISEQDIQDAIQFLWNSIRDFFSSWSTARVDKYYSRMYFLLDLCNVDISKIGFPEPQEFFLEKLFREMQAKEGVYEFFGSLFMKRLTQAQIEWVLQNVLPRCVGRIEDVSEMFTIKRERILRRHGEVIGDSMIKNLRHHPHWMEENL